MFEQDKFVDLVGKTYKLTSKFKFALAAEKVNEMISYLKAESAAIKEWGDSEDWSDKPEPVIWLDRNAKGSAVLRLIEVLKTELQCDCKPVFCKCDPTENVKANPKLKCKFCSAPLINSGAKWISSKNYAICSFCNEVLFDVFYPEQRASEKINDVLENATWWTMGERPQYTKALELLSEAKNWCLEAASFSNAVN